MHFAIQGLKMAKTKELSRDIWNTIIERPKGGQGYRKISKELNPSKKWKTEKNKWAYFKVDQQINPFITRSEIKTDLEGTEINVSKDTISRA